MSGNLQNSNLVNTNKEANLLLLTANSIRNDNLAELDVYLRIMPLEQISDNRDSILEKFLILAASLQRRDASNYILDRWKVLYPDNDKFSIFTRLFLLSNNLKMLSYVCEIHPEFTYLELMDELCDFDASQESILACGKADDVFGIQPHDTYKLVEARALESQNYVIQEYVKENLEFTAPLAPKPDWIRDFNILQYNSNTNFTNNNSTNNKQIIKQKTIKPEIKLLPSESDLYSYADTLHVENTELDMDVSEIVSFLIAGLEKNGVVVNGEDERSEMEKTIRKELQNPKIRQELIAPLLQNKKDAELQNNNVLFRIFGPSNPLVGPNYLDSNISSKYGGARMFLFNLFDYSEEYDRILDWFTGNCYQCNLQIKERWYAVRKPSPMGGWKNCYCSWKCVRDDITETENATDEIDHLSHKLTDIFENEISQIGIQDRS